MSPLTTIASIFFPPIASQPLPEQESLQLINELKQFNGQIGYMHED